MTRWLHTDADCPRRPIFARRIGQTYECRCGRVWEYAAKYGARRWKLVRRPKPPEDSER